MTTEQAELQCDICNRLMENSQQLECSHRFCLNCSERYFENFHVAESLHTSGVLVAKIKCPLCHVETSITGRSLQNLPGDKLFEWANDKNRQENASSCPHSSIENRRVCRHCGAQFCKDCQKGHKELLKLEISEMCDSYLNLRSKIDEAQISLNIEQLRKRLNADLNDIRDVLQRSADRAVVDARKDTEDVLSKVDAMVHSGELDCVGTMTKIADMIRSTSVLHVNMEDVTKMHRAIADCHDAIKTMGKPRRQTNVFYQSNNNVNDVALAKPIVAEESTKVPKEIEREVKVYSTMAMVGSISGNDCLGQEIKRPSIVTRIRETNGSTAAILHNENRITLIDSEGHLLCTYQLYDPDDVNVEASFIDMTACCNHLFLSDLDHRIVSVDLRFLPLPPGGVFLPSIFARSTATEACVGYRGLAISLQRKALYTFDGSELQGFNLSDGSVFYRNKNPLYWRYRLMAVRDIPLKVDSKGLASTLPPELQLFFTSDEGHTLWSSSLPTFNQIIQPIQISQAGSRIGKVRGIRPGGVTFDVLGNIFIADNQNGRIQVKSSSLQLVHTFTWSENSHLFDPRSVACLRVAAASFNDPKGSIETFMQQSSDDSSESLESLETIHFEDDDEKVPYLETTILIVADGLPGQVLLFAPVAEPIP